MYTNKTFNGYRIKDFYAWEVKYQLLNARNEKNILTERGKSESWEGKKMKSKFSFS